VVERRSSNDVDESIAGYAIAGFGPVVVGALLVSVRDDIEHTTAALILVVVVVLAAWAGGRASGAFAAVVAAASFDFFLTRPYLSLRIESEADIETTFVLLVIGLLVGQIVVSARRSHRAADRASDEIGRLRRIAEQAATNASSDDLKQAVEAELLGLMGLRECTFVHDAPESGLPRIERSGALTVTQHRFTAGGEFALPAAGVELPVIGRGEVLGRFILTPDPDAGVSLDARIVAVALADQLGAALAARGGEVPE
jgi:K+-sensing histidine kinase KdpD